MVRFLIMILFDLIQEEKNVQNSLSTCEKQMDQLESLLIENKIPYKRYDCKSSSSLVIGNEEEPLCECVYSLESIGFREGLLEIAGGLTDREMEVAACIVKHKYQGFKGFLTAEEVFKRMKFCYENNTSEYVEEIEDFSLSINEFKIIERSFENWTKSNVNNFKVDLEKKYTQLYCVHDSKRFI